MFLLKIACIYYIGPHVASAYINPFNNPINKLAIMHWTMILNLEPLLSQPKYMAKIALQTKETNIAIL